MARRLAACLACAALGPAACSDASKPPLSPSCTQGSEAVERALRAAPGRVALPDGSLLSDCVRNARSDAELQDVGITLSRAADHLTDRATAGDIAAALGLGYLAGAARRGGKRTNGVGVELVRRVELRAGRMLGADATGRRAPAVRAAVRRGLAAGERAG